MAQPVLRKHYHTGLNKIIYGFPSTCFMYYNADNHFNFSLFIFLNFDLIPSVNVSGNFDRLPKSIKDTTFFLYFMIVHAKIRYEMNASHLKCLRLNLRQESQKPRNT